MSYDQGAFQGNKVSIHFGTQEMRPRCWMLSTWTPIDPQAEKSGISIRRKRGLVLLDGRPRDRSPLNGWCREDWEHYSASPEIRGRLCCSSCELVGVSFPLVNVAYVLACNPLVSLTSNTTCALNYPRNAFNSWLPWRFDCSKKVWIVKIQILQTLTVNGPLTTCYYWSARTLEFERATIWIKRAKIEYDMRSLFTLKVRFYVEGWVDGI